MKGFSKHGLAMGAVLWVSSAFAAASSDYGVVTQLFTNASNMVAVYIPGGFVNAVNTGQCSGSNGWAGVSADPGNNAMKATLMAAKASGSPVAIVIDGCEAGGAWFRIVNVYWQ